jgi:hypothetical protein
VFYYFYYQFTDLDTVENITKGESTRLHNRSGSTTMANLLKHPTDPSLKIRKGSGIQLPWLSDVVISREMQRNT